MNGGPQKRHTCREGPPYPCTQLPPGRSPRARARCTPAPHPPTPPRHPPTPSLPHPPGSTTGRRRQGAHGKGCQRGCLSSEPATADVPAPAAAAAVRPTPSQQRIHRRPAPSTNDSDARETRSLSSSRGSGRANNVVTTVQEYSLLARRPKAQARNPQARRGRRGDAEEEGRRGVAAQRGRRQPRVLRGQNENARCGNAVGVAKDANGGAHPGSTPSRCPPPPLPPTCRLGEQGKRKRRGWLVTKRNSGGSAKTQVGRGGHESGRRPSSKEGVPGSPCGGGRRVRRPCRASAEEAGETQFHPAPQRAPLRRWHDPSP